MVAECECQLALCGSKYYTQIAIFDTTSSFDHQKQYTCSQIHADFKQTCLIAINIVVCETDLDVHFGCHCTFYAGFITGKTRKNYEPELKHKKN